MEHFPVASKTWNRGETDFNTYMEYNIIGTKLSFTRITCSRLAYLGFGDFEVVFVELSVCRCIDRSNQADS